MKIKRLKLVNYRNHADTELNFGDVGFIVIRGKNASGKSSIRHGISMCVTPTTEGLDPKGTGFHSKIKRGQPRAVIEADVQTRHHLIRREVVLNTNSTGRSQHTVCLSDPTWRPKLFEDHLEKHRAALGVVLNTEMFLKLDEDKQKSLMAGMVLPLRYDWDKEIVASVESVLGLDAKAIRFENDGPFEVIGRAYKRLFDERQIVNRQVREFVIPEALPIPTNVDSKLLEDQLAQARAERVKRMEERDRAVAEANRAEVAQSRAHTKIQVIKDQIAAEERRAEELGKTLLPDDRLASLKKVANGKAQLDKLEKETKDVDRLIDDYRKQVVRLEAMVSGIGECPTCGQVIDPERLVRLGNDLAEWMNKATDKHRQLTQKISALGEVDEAADLLERHEKARTEYAEIGLRIADKRQQLEAAQREVSETIPFDFQPYDRSLAECDAEVERLASTLRPVIAAEFRRKEIAILEGQLVTLKEKAALLDRLVKYFDKDGIKAKLLAEYIGGFELKINEVMSAWGYHCELQIEPYSFNVTNARGDTNPAGELSGAERVMFSAAFQCAVSRTAGIGLVVIDEVDRLLPELRAVLNKKLYEMTTEGYLEQIILLVADTSEQVPAIQGTAIFMVKDGTVARLAAKEA